MQEQRNSIWAWAIGTGIFVFVVFWWMLHVHSWLAVLFGIVAAGLVWALSLWKSAPQPVVASAAPPKAPVATPAPPMATMTPTQDMTLTAAIDTDDIVEDIDNTPMTSATPPAQSPSNRAAPKRAAAARTTSKPRSGDTRTEPRAKAAPKAAAKAEPKAATKKPEPVKTAAPAKPAAAAAAAKAPAPKAATAKAPAAKTATAKAPAEKPVAPKAAAKPTPKPATPKAAAKPAAPKPAAAPAKPDDLKVIKGIGPKIEKALHELGVTSFAQIAKWTKKDIASFDDAIAGPTRIEADDWIGQAKVLAKAPKKP